MPDHVNMMVSIPPKYSVSQEIGFMEFGPPELVVDGDRACAQVRFWHLHRPTAGGSRMLCVAPRVFGIATTDGHVWLSAQWGDHKRTNPRIPIK